MPRKPNKHLTPEQLLNRIRKLARYAANVGQTCYDKETLKAKKCYTDEQADAYISAFNEKAGTPQEQAIRQARHTAQMAAARGASCPTKEALLEKGYSEQALKAYLAAYKESKGTTEEQALKKARHAAQMAAGKGVPCPTKEALLEKGYTKRALKVYLAAYEESKGTGEEQAIRKARRAAQVAASDGTPCPTKEVLIKRGYSEQASEVYLATYEKSKKDKKTRLIREQELQQLQDLLNHSSEINDHSCIASFVNSLGYQESTSSLTEQDEQYLAEVLGEESTNNNRLLVNFILAESTSLTTSGFLSIFEEENEEKNAMTVVYSSQVLR